MAQKYINGLVIQEQGNDSAFQEEIHTELQTQEKEIKSSIPAGIKKVVITTDLVQAGTPITVESLPVASVDYKDLLAVVLNGNVKSYYVCLEQEGVYSWKSLVLAPEPVED